MKRKQASLILTLFFVLLAFSQTWGAIGVSTLSIWVTVPAGETITGTLIFTNFHEEEMNLVIMPCDWKRLEGGENVLLEKNSLDNSLTPYVKVTPEEVLLNPGESRKFRYEIAMPEEATGALWGAILAVPRNKIIELGGSSENYEGEVSLNELAKHGFTVKVWAIEPSSATPSGKINSLEPIRTGGEESLYRFKLDFANTGNVPLRPQGILKILDPADQKIAEYDLDKFGILPGSHRVIQVPDSGISLPGGEISTEAVLRFGNNEIARERIALELE
ncbi:hypothetical protein KGY72_08980 [Candidatus Bipolaricaulota bacterium]|nr:hypothetical protein [Candidatus Bipolaricaulota bacterium]MBS3792686.1 hypothetical protein [Candidatus Bipolaricaulota bacterium]